MAVIFTFGMAPFSCERRRKGGGVMDAELELGGPRGSVPPIMAPVLETTFLPHCMNSKEVLAQIQGAASM